MDRLRDTLMELGHGMALVGRQFRPPLGDGDEFIIDLLFFDIEQLRYVVVELKVGPSTTAHPGQLGANVAVVDGELRSLATHAPTAGIRLCTGKGGAAVQYVPSSSKDRSLHADRRSQARLWVGSHARAVRLVSQFCYQLFACRTSAGRLDSPTTRSA